MGKLYDSDFYGWTIEQADALKRKSLNEIDWHNLVEEIETLGRSELSQLESRFEVLLIHLLKWQFQPEQRTRSWRNTIAEQRRKIRKLLKQNPSMAPKVGATLSDAYEDARQGAADETELELAVLPSACPYRLEETIDDTFWPGPSTD
ncbi:MAG: DUF29 domain-containing protein [Alphaproteobacteria bacterium]